MRMVLLFVSTTWMICCLPSGQRESVLRLLEHQTHVRRPGTRSAELLEVCICCTGNQASQGTEVSFKQPNVAYVFPQPGGPQRMQLPTPSPASIRERRRLPGPTRSVWPMYLSSDDGRDRSASLKLADAATLTAHGALAFRGFTRCRLSGLLSSGAGRLPNMPFPLL